MARRLSDVSRQPHEEPNPIVERLLLTTVLTPLAGAALIWVFAVWGRDAVRWVALLTTLVAAVFAGYLVFSDAAASSTVEDFGSGWSWFASDQATVDVRFHLALDGLSVWMFGLTTLLMITSVLISWDAIEDEAATYYGLLLLLETGMLGVFAARDIILFYVFFEFTLIPLFLIIGVWGSEERRLAAIKFFLFTLAGSVLTFLGLLAIVAWNYYHAGDGTLTFSIVELTAGLDAAPIETSWQIVIFLALFAGFAIKVPLFPLHTWLPLAHVQAPAAGSVLLAGVLLKIGTYGFLRFSLPMLPEASVICMPWILWLSTAGIIYGALVALAQQDMKRLIAYSSVSHLGFCMLGLFSMNRLGLQGGALQMINHGLSTGGLFAVVGMLYERYHTRQIRDLGGIARRMPVLAFFMLVFTFSSIGLPGLNGFAGEFLLLTGMFQRGWAGIEGPIAWQLKAIAVIAVLGVVIGAWYMLWLVERVFFGPLREPTGHHGENDPPHDLSFREIVALSPLVVFVVWIGIAPGQFLNRMAPALDPLSDRLEVEIAEQFDVVPQPEVARAEELNGDD